MSNLHVLAMIITILFAVIIYLRVLNVLRLHIQDLDKRRAEAIKAINDHAWERVKKNDN